MHRLAVAGFLPVLFAAASGAQSQPVVTEAEFLSALDVSHPAVAESVEGLAIARARVFEASTFDNPGLDIVREEPSEQVKQTDILVNWQLPHFARRPTVEAREEAATAASLRLSQRLKGLRQEMRQAYADWALAVARIERLVVQAERVEALAERELARAERGETTGLEADRLQLAASALRVRVALLESARVKARAEAARWVPTLPPGARPMLPELPPPPDLVAEHPLVEAAAADLVETQLEIEAARRFVLSPQVSVGWQRQDLGAESLDGPILGIAWPVPLFDRNRSEKAAAEARHAGAQARLELIRREVAASRTAALAAFVSLSGSLEQASSALTSAERMLDGAEAAFRLGEGSLTDLLATHRSVAEGELAVLDLREAALAAHRELERLASFDQSTDPLNGIDPLAQENSQ